MPSSPGYAFFGPETVENDWQYIDGLETVTFYIRTTDAFPTTGGLVVPNCLFRAKSEALDNLLDTKQVPLHIWRNQIPNGQVTFTADMNAGSLLLRNVSVTISKPMGGTLIPGQFVRGSGIKPRTWITQVNGNTATLSQPATESDDGVNLFAAVIPKQNDVVVDGEGNKWIAQRSDIQTFSTRFRLPMLLAIGK